MKRYGGLLFIGLIPFLIAGCASLSAHQISASFDRPRDCDDFFKKLDEQVREARVRNASSTSIPGFPYLRTNRFLSAMRDRLKDDGERKEWVEWMFDLHLQAREKEIWNLPPGALSFFASLDREGLLAQMRACAQKLLRHDQESPHFYSLLEPRVIVPDEYSLFLRVAGLYPLFAIPVAAVTENARKKMRQRFTVDLEALPKDGILSFYVPEGGLSLSKGEIEEILRTVRGNSLNTPRLEASQAKRLAQTFAPILIQDVVASYDRFGQVLWKNLRPTVDPNKPVVYYYMTHAFMKHEPVLQINYVIWYSERAGKNPPWMERGALDGLTIRLTLDPDGTPFMVDIQNNCGCYHFFVPDQKRFDHVLPKTMGFDALILQFLPEVSTPQRLGILVNSGWHQPQRLIAVQAKPDSISYELMPYDLLESIPHEDGATESLFDEKGIAKGSQRIERFILFSMGIPSIGSMRQRGHHAIELIGRVHFDDPYLFDQHFIFK